jgi:hypothetical protein
MQEAQAAYHFFSRVFFFIHERPLSFIHNDDLLAARARRSDAQCIRVWNKRRAVRKCTRRAKFRSIWALGIFPNSLALFRFSTAAAGEQKKKKNPLSLAHMRCGRCFQLFLSKTHTAREREEEQHITNIIKATKLLCGATKKEETERACFVAARRVSERVCVCEFVLWKPV